MAAATGHVAQAFTDEDDRLVAADEPLAGLQLRCGGELPGTIAIPALLEAVRKARRYQMKLARTMIAQDNEDAFTAYLEVQPRRNGAGGCEVSLRDWRTSPLPAEDEFEIARRKSLIDRQLGELWALLDREQRLQAVQGDAPDLSCLVSAMQQGMGRAWTDFIAVDGMEHLQPMHWRLLDGAKVSVEGSLRPWRAHLIPRIGQVGEPNGFELLLISDEPPPLPEWQKRRASDRGPSSGARLVGKEVAPVLRQPISRIIANAESIRTRLAGPIADDYADYAAEIAAAGQHLLGLLDDLSDLEVVESEDFRTAPDAIDLADVARQAAGILSVRAKEKDIRLKTPEADESLPATAEFRRVLQILLNLVGNAIRYSPPGSEVWIRLNEANGRSEAIVADQGPGIAPEDAEKVFDKFERLGRSGDGGSGLGLYISKRLATAMGGDLTVESGLGQGARFTLSLPGPYGRSADPAAEADQ